MGFSGWDIAGLRAWNFPTEGAPERTFPWSPFNMIKTLWARVSKMWLLGELGMGFFYSAPQDFVMLGVFCARFPPRDARLLTLNSRVELGNVKVLAAAAKRSSKSQEKCSMLAMMPGGGPIPRESGRADSPLPSRPWRWLLLPLSAHCDCRGARRSVR